MHAMGLPAALLVVLSLSAAGVAQDVPEDAVALSLAADECAVGGACSAALALRQLRAAGRSTGSPAGGQSVLETSGGGLPTELGMETGWPLADAHVQALASRQPPKNSSASLLTTAHSCPHGWYRESRWFGTAPWCNAVDGDCRDNNCDPRPVRDSDHGDGSRCWSGRKVLCESCCVNPNSPDYAR